MNITNGEDIRTLGVVIIWSLAGGALYLGWILWFVLKVKARQ